MRLVITKKRHFKVSLFFGDPDWIQTSDPNLRRILLCSAELRDHFDITNIVNFIKSSKFISKIF
jgi:hypothetical protein